MHKIILYLLVIVFAAKTFSMELVYIPKIPIDNSPILSLRDMVACYVAENQVPGTAITSERVHTLLPQELCERVSQMSCVQSMLQAGVEEGKIALRDRAWQEGANPDDIAHWRHLFNAAKRGDEDGVIRLLLGYPGIVHAIDIKFSTPLHKASHNGFDRVVEILIGAGACVNSQDTSGQMPLHKAAIGGNSLVTQMLIEEQAEIGAPDNKGRTPLHEAAQGGHHAIVSQLLGAGACVDVQDETGETPLHEAARGQYLETVRALLQAGANPLLPASDSCVHGCCRNKIPREIVLHKTHGSLELREQIQNLLARAEQQWELEHPKLRKKKIRRSPEDEDF